MTKYKANHNLRLPDGKTEVMAGDTFEYDGDISGFADIVEPVIEQAPAAPEANPEDKNPAETPAAFGLEGLSDEEIRAQGKAWKIKNYHSMGIENLKKKIYEAYEAAAPEGDAPEVLKQPDAGFEVDNIPEDKNPDEGEGAADAGK